MLSKNLKIIKERRTKMNHKHFASGVKSFDDEKMQITHYISTVTPDRYGDIVNPYGIDDSNYRKNPVVLFGHNYNSVAAGKNISLSSDDNGVIAVTQFADTPEGRDLYRLNRDGFLNAWSIGFIPKKMRKIKRKDWEYHFKNVMENKSGTQSNSENAQSNTEIRGFSVFIDKSETENKSGTQNSPENAQNITEKSDSTDATYNFIEEWELLEYSSVAVPANPDAVNLIFKNISSIEIKNCLLESSFDKTTGLSDRKNIKIITGLTKTQKKGEKEMKDENLLTSSHIPTEGFMSAENKENINIIEGRNLIKSIVYGKPELMPLRYKDFLNETTNSAGGYLVPKEWYDRIVSLVTEGGTALRNATVYNMSRKELIIPKLDNLPSFSFVTEGTLKPVSNPSFAQVILTRRDGGFIVLFSKQLLEDNAFDIMGFVSNLAAKIMANTIDTAAFRGLAPVSGILSPNSGAYIVETSGEEISSMTYDNLVAMTSAVPSHTLGNAKWYMHRTLYGFIKTLRYSPGGEYVLSPQERKDRVLEGFPVELTDACYAFGETEPDKSFIAFGDFKNCAIGIRNNLKIDYSKEASVAMGGQTVNLWQSGLIGLSFGMSFDVKFTYPIAISVLKTAAA